MQIKEFIQTIEGLAENTRKSYEQTLWQLDSTLDGDEPSKDEIYSFLKEYPPSSLHRHRAAIKAYLEFTKPGQPWPFTKRQFPLKRQRVPRHVSPETVQNIIDISESEDERMFVKTLFQLGCRIAELMSIEADRITASGVRVVTKGGNEYLKVTTKEFNRELKEYAKTKQGRVFPRPYSYYDQLLKRLAKIAGHPNMTLHMLRHGRAIDLLRKGMALSDIQQFLNHASINTTSIYLQVTGGELSKELEKVESHANSTLLSR